MASNEFDPVVFVDTETVGLRPERHDVWEIALIEADGTEHLWWLKPRIVDEIVDAVGVKHQSVRAEEGAFRVNRFYERVAEKIAARKAQGLLTRGWEDMTLWDDPKQVAWDIARLTSNKRLVGCVPNFDANMFVTLLRDNRLIPAWHYHQACVMTLAAGKLGVRPPWDSRKLSKTLGVEPPGSQDAHTALGDARWAREMYLKVFSAPV